MCRVLLISNHNGSESCLIKLLPYILFEKCIYILALEMASPGNQHCASCISTLPFSITWGCRSVQGTSTVPVVLAHFHSLLHGGAHHLSNMMDQSVRQQRCILSLQLLAKLVLCEFLLQHHAVESVTVL